MVSSIFRRSWFRVCISANAARAPLCRDWTSCEMNSEAQHNERSRAGEEIHVLPGRISDLLNYPQRLLWSLLVKHQVLLIIGIHDISHCATVKAGRNTKSQRRVVKRETHQSWFDAPFSVCTCLYSSSQPSYILPTLSWIHSEGHRSESSSLWNQRLLVYFVYSSRSKRWFGFESYLSTAKFARLIE